MAKGVSIHIGLNAVDPIHYRDAQGGPWHGELLACENDARAMAGLAECEGFDVTPPLLTSNATSAAVIAGLERAVSALATGDILFLTYSGHGGQVLNTNPDDDPDEDALDETWCLFDRQLLDDELFAVFSGFRQGVRILVFSDSCHSGTVTRRDPVQSAALPAAKQPPGSVLAATEARNADVYGRLQRDIPSKRLADLKASVVLLSGCQDHQFSRDGTEHGAFTGALLAAWQEASARRSMRALQKAVGSRIPREYEQVPNLFVYAFDVAPPLRI
jgi:hypothetical protein